MSTVQLIVGLGNPGVRYARTRHNLGFMVLNELADHCGTSIDGDAFGGAHARADIGENPVHLFLPKRYMNLSGEPVRAFADHHQITADQILIVHDDIDLPLGRLRLRHRGGDGGHRGLRSVIGNLDSKNFKRLRLGIGRPQQRTPAEYVLSPFEEQEIPVVEAVIQHAVHGVDCLCSQGYERAANWINALRIN